LGYSFCHKDYIEQYKFTGGINSESKVINMKVQNINSTKIANKKIKLPINLKLFFLITIIFTWVFWIPDALAKQGLISSSIFTNLGFLGSLGPLIASILIVLKESGKDGLKKLFIKNLHKKFEAKWWFLIFLLFPALIILSYYISVSLDQVYPKSEASGLYYFIPFIFFSVMFTGGPVQEEFGWRGYALPRLQEKFSPFLSSLILGFIWAIWHWPQFLIPKELTGMFFITPFWSFILTVISANFIYTWIYNNTKGSILAVLILHTQMNLFLWIFPVLYTQYGYLIILVVFTITASLVILFDKKQFLNKMRS